VDFPVIEKAGFGLVSAHIGIFVDKEIIPNATALEHADELG
jgi:hypothetical protein